MGVRGPLKAIVVSSTVVFAIFGLAMMIVGIIGLKNMDDYEKDIPPLSLFPMRNFCVAVITMGVLLFLICSAGVLGVFKKLNKLMSVYTLLLFVLVACQLTVALILSGQFGEQLEQEVDRNVRSQWFEWYTANEGLTDVYGENEKAIFRYQKKLECCGYDYIADNQNRNDMTLDPNGYTTTPHPHDDGFTYRCLLDPSVDEPLTWYDKSLERTKKNAEGEDVELPQGGVLCCRQATVDFFNDVTKPVFVTLLVMSCLQLVVVFMTCYLMRKGKGRDDATDVWASPYSY
ncbi:MAG: hypothetical protein MHM6MM_003103 [Cercozoa sp. M6MM]